VELDFAKLAGGSTVDTLLDPQEIFAALPSKAFSHLRAVQSEVLDAWFARRTDRDLAIKMNTGGGKTAVGLLALKSSLNEKVGPAMYVAPDTYLVDQVLKEAGQLGLTTTTDPDTATFRGGEAILVITLAKLINGRSVFGVAGSLRQTVHVGAIVIDDAHTALTTTETQFSLRLPNDHPAYVAVLDLFADDLRRQSATTYADLRDADPSAVQRVPFWAWADQQDRVLEILRPHRDETPIMFTWPLLVDVLPVCACVATAREIEIRPPCPPIAKLPTFSDAPRRIYLTATLADESVLVTDFDADPDSVSRPITPKRASDLGDRMILAPLEIFPTATDDAIHDLVREIANEVNVVVLVPSRRRAQAWADIARETLYVGGLDAGVRRLQSGHVGLVVMVNKYDGVDLPGDACRLLVLDGLPQVFSATERREAGALADSKTMVSRQLQRIEQGMGRGVRDSQDHCAVLLLDNKLTHLLHDPQAEAVLSAATRAQLALSRKVAAQLKGQELYTLRGVLDYCLKEDERWVAASRGALAELRYPSTGQVAQIAIAHRQAFDLAAVGQYAEAARTLSEGLNTLDDLRQVAWLKEQLATYSHFIDASRAQQILAGAVRQNPAVLRPLEGVSYQRVGATDNQAAAAARLLGENYGDGVQLVLGINALLDDLAWDEDATDGFEEALKRLGEHLGFAAQRPDHDTGTGPDVLWALDAYTFIVIEAKSGANTDIIFKRDVDQLAGSMNWFREIYGTTCSATPIMVHRAQQLHEQASASEGMRVLTPERLEALKRGVRSLAVALADGVGQWSDSAAVSVQLRQHNLTQTAFATTYTAPFRAAR
jgi:Helicase C-terminal domain/DEAD/DEAH box helicase